MQGDHKCRPIGINLSTSPCHPERSEGSRPHRPGSSSLPCFTHVSPLRIDRLDQGHLLCAHSALDLLLPRESSIHVGRLFKVNQACNKIGLNPSDRTEIEVNFSKKSYTMMKTRRRNDAKTKP